MLSVSHFMVCRNMPVPLVTRRLWTMPCNSSNVLRNMPWILCIMGILRQKLGIGNRLPICACRNWTPISLSHRTRTFISLNHMPTSIVSVSCPRWKRHCVISSIFSQIIFSILRHITWTSSSRMTGHVVPDSWKAMVMT